MANKLLFIFSLFFILSFPLAALSTIQEITFEIEGMD